ncbi:MAG: ATP-dependent transcriptional regulator, partial [Pseudorhodobacter sp.]
LARDPNTAISAFAEAGRIYRSLPGGQVHAAHVDMQLAAYALARGQADKAMQIADRTMPVVAAAENAALMATLMLVKAEALQMMGRQNEAAAVRIDSRGWARYGFGSDAQIQARVSEISALARRGNKS